jgi:D-alanyl-D-alanine carboxypeptidase
MRELISDHFKEASLRRTAPVIADAGELRATAAFPVALARAPLTARADPAPTASVKAGAAAAPSPASLASANDPIKPLLVRTITYRTAPVATAPLAPMPALVPVGTPAQQATIRPQATAAAERPRTVVASADPVVDLKAAAAKANAAPSRPAMGAITPAPQVAAPVVQAPVAAAPVAPPPAIVAPVAAARATPSPITTAFADATDRDQVEPTEPARPEPFLPSSPVHARNGGWLIQIGAFDDESDAKQHLSAAQIKVHGALAAKDPFTERVLKGDKAYYRARFAGFDKATAEAACKQLKRSDFECMALKD